MLGIFYTSLSGMSAYSEGLNVISNNVANLNTPGFRVNVPEFRDLTYQSGAPVARQGAGDAGAGVRMEGSRQSPRPGDIRSTGNPLDLALEGDGYFILRGADGDVYTRAGQFEFDSQGLLVDRQSGRSIDLRTLTDSGSLSINDYRVMPPVQTREVRVTGNLARGPEDSYELGDIQVVDGNGETQVFSLQFRQSTTDPLQWVVEAVDSQFRPIGTTALSFDTDGAFASDGDGLELRFIDSELAQPVSVSFGQPGSFSGTTSLLGSPLSQLQAQRSDGRAAGSLTGVRFDDQGRLNLSYSNGESEDIAQLELARFLSLDRLEPLGGGLYQAVGDAAGIRGAPLTVGLGRVIGGSIELSNVDLPDQFTDLIIIQRGYQGSSQLASVANEMIQQLLQIGSGR